MNYFLPEAMNVMDSVFKEPRGKWFTKNMHWFPKSKALSSLGLPKDIKLGLGSLTGLVGRVLLLILGS